MIFTKEQTKKFEEAARPLMKFLAENSHPHTKAIVDSTSAEAVEGICCVRTEAYIID